MSSPPPPSGTPCRGIASVAVAAAAVAFIGAAAVAAAAAPTTISARRRPAWVWDRTAVRWREARKARAVRREEARSPNLRSRPLRPPLRLLHPPQPPPPRRDPPAARRERLHPLRFPRGSNHSSSRRFRLPLRLPPAHSRNPSPAPAPRRPAALRKDKDSLPAAALRGRAARSRGRTKVAQGTAADRAGSHEAAGSSTRASRAWGHSRAREKGARSCRTR